MWNDLLPSWTRGHRVRRVAADIVPRARKLAVGIVPHVYRRRWQHPEERGRYWTDLPGPGPDRFGQRPRRHA